ncbi:MAG: hypothetical protein JKX78_01460 [Alteromonadaceae bacterium]|nr:hypothetical protein [Alteromonadaceae bacterium]
MNNTLINDLLKITKKSLTYSSKYYGDKPIINVITPSLNKWLLVCLSIGYVSSTNANSIKIPIKESCPKKQVNFKRNTIFNEQDKDTLFFHRWANALHITTKKITLENEAAFFLNKCRYNKKDLAELERHLRNRKYIRDAKVTTDENLKNIQVETWDNWSLMPTLSFGRKGGVNTYSIGIKDRNLFGLGIDAQLQSFTNAQRSGYKLDTVIPLFQKQNTELSLRVANNDDGKQNTLFVQKKFASLTTKYAYSIGFNDEKRSDTIFQNNQTLTIFKHNIDYKAASLAWLSDSFTAYLKNDDDTLRFSLGLTQNKQTFKSLNDNLLSTTTQPEVSTKNSTLPQNRNFTYPWFKMEYIERDYKKLTNIHLVTQIEDFNLGWHVKTKLGIADGNKVASAWALWRSSISKGFSFNERTLAFVNFSFNGDVYDAGKNRLYTQFNGELFYHLSKKWNIYLANTTIYSKNQYLDQPITLGGDTGMRGFPLQYQHGSRSTKFTSELRYYPHINIYKLFELAGAAYIDVGKASGQSLATNIDPDWLYSIGIGARIYSTHASIGRVIHIDLAKPFSDNPDLNGYEIRIQAKETF